MSKQKYNYDDFVYIILYLSETAFPQHSINDEYDAETLLQRINLYHFKNGWFDYDKYDAFKQLVIELEKQRERRTKSVTDESVAMDT